MQIRLKKSNDHPISVHSFKIKTNQDFKRTSLGHSGQMQRVARWRASVQQMSPTCAQTFLCVGKNSGSSVGDLEFVFFLKKNLFIFSFVAIMQDVYCHRTLYGLILINVLAHVLDGPGFLQKLELEWLSRVGFDQWPNLTHFLIINKQTTSFQIPCFNRFNFNIIQTTAKPDTSYFHDADTHLTKSCLRVLPCLLCIFSRFIWIFSSYSGIELVLLSRYILIRCQLFQF